MRADRFIEDVSSELPELVVCELTADEIAELRDADDTLDKTGGECNGVIEESCVGYELNQPVIDEPEL